MLKVVPSGAQMHVDPAALRRDMFAHRLPWSEKYRNVYGRLMDLDRIEQALLAARVGIMVDIADLAREQLMYDPHLGKLPQRRFGALQISDWTLTPRTEGLSREEKREAAAICDMVRRKLQRIKGFRQAIYDLAWAQFDGRAALEIAWDWEAFGRFPYQPTALSWIHPRRIGLGPQRELRLIETFVRVGWFEPVGLAFDEVPGKFITSSPRRFGDYPELEGLAPRSIYYSFFKRFAARQRMILTELFTLPWRTLEADANAPIQREDVEAAVEDAEALGDQTTAGFQPGLKLKVWWPGTEHQGQIFQATSDDVDSQMSRLWMLTDDTGKSGADAAGGTGGDQAGLLKEQHGLVKQLDGVAISEVIQRDLIEKIVLLNCGPDSVELAPIWELATQPPKDRVTAQKVYSQAILDGVPVSLSDYYRDLDLRPPEDDEPVLVMMPGAAQGSPGAIKILVPPGAKPPAGMPPPAAPAMGGGDSPRPPEATVQNPIEQPNVSAKGETPELPAHVDDDPGEIPQSETDRPNETSWEPEPSDEDDASADPMAAIDMPNQASLGQDELAGDGLQPGEELEEAVRKVLGLTRRARRLSRHPDLGHGSPEIIIDRGLREGVRYTSIWAVSLTASVEGLGTATAIHRALDQAEQALSLDLLASSLERCLVRGTMLGALDSALEAEDGDPVAIPAFERAPTLLALGKGTPGFAATPFAEAIRFFLHKAVLPRRAFDRLRAEAKAKAFTVAGLARTEMLETAKSALARALELGSDLRAFGKDLGERFDSAGWTRIKPSHVELILRNNVMGAYADGRDRQMRQPEVLAARPYWQILGVDDARTRPAHRAAHGKVLRADDPLWAKASPPFGHACRCRKVSRSAADLKRLGLAVTSGTTIRGLPDPGWR